MVQTRVTKGSIQFGNRHRLGTLDRKRFATPEIRRQGPAFIGGEADIRQSGYHVA